MAMKWHVLAAGLAVMVSGIAAALPVAAQDVVFDAGANDACLMDGGWVDCIGIASGQCMEDTADGYTTVGMVQCLGAELAYWDDALNAAYAETMTAAQSDDTRTMPEGTPSTVETLRDMQRAWIAYRDATCLYESLDMWGGTGEGLIRTSCLMQMTGQQALYLQSLMAAG